MTIDGRAIYLSLEEETEYLNGNKNHADAALEELLNKLPHASSVILYASNRTTELNELRR